MKEIEITRGIIENHVASLDRAIESDVVIVGAGPSGLVAGGYLAEKGYNVTMLEKRLSPGGGIWGGGMGYKFVIIQEAARDILDDFHIPYRGYGTEYVCVDAINFASGLIFEATRRGVNIFNLTVCEDLMVREGRVSGVVINNSLTELNHLPVDPLTLEARAVVDATGHDHDVVATFSRKNDVRLNTPAGKPMGERSMFAQTAEDAVVENTSEVYPGLFVCGMSTAAVYGGHRMGPIFGGMLLSGKKLAGLLEDACSS